MWKELTTFCEGVNNTVWCGEIDWFIRGKEIDEVARKKLPVEYEKWEIEKAGLHAKTFKIYIQLRFHNLIRTVIL